MQLAVYAYVVVAAVFSMNNVVLTDEKPSMNISLDRTQIQQILRGIDNGQRIIIEIDHAKLRSCGNNVSGVDLLISGFYTHRIHFGEPSLNPRTADFELDITPQLRMIRPFSPLWDGKFSVKVKPVFTDKNVTGCFSASCRSVKVLVKDK